MHKFAIPSNVIPVAMQRGKITFLCKGSKILQINTCEQSLRVWVSCS